MSNGRVTIVTAVADSVIHNAAMITMQSTCRAVYRFMTELETLRGVRSQIDYARHEDGTSAE
jgi:hypothetical protein